MKILSLFLLFLVIGYSWAQENPEYKISGTVTKKGGEPLEGVTVLLKGKDVSVVTGADGTFEIPEPIAIRLQAPQTQTISFKLHGNAVTFSPAAGTLNGNVTILSGNGRQIASMNFSDLNPVTEQISLPRLASGLNILRITVNNVTHTCQVIRVGSELHFHNKHTSVSGENFTLNKRAASSEAVDTLIATKEEFEEVRMPIAAYILEDVAIEMDSIVEGAEIAWGRKENPTAGLCPVDDLPGFNELESNKKLPDPFMMLDGTRITKKSEWACRREELYQQILHYIYGDKPIPPEGSVSGTVSTSSIEVKVDDGNGCSFSASVNMNGASQPAPAIIYYGSMAGAPAPSGVAKITFNPVETTGGSGSKSGKFYDCYGRDHEAGYMAAQAWEVSRIIDVLEQNPDVIDPYRLGVTGCSRWGKGAFVAGVLDNRIALTLPEESGIGGAVALRLVEQLGGGEWPYHSISYVRWLSEVTLGPFTRGNNAGADNTDRLPVDIHEAMALIAPRACYIIDNPGINNLDPKEAWVTASAGKKVYEALGVGDNFAYVGAGGSHCAWRGQYNNELNAMIDKFLKGNASAQTGSMTGNASANVDQFIDWDASELEGELFTDAE